MKDNTKLARLYLDQFNRIGDDLWQQKQAVLLRHPGAWVDPKARYWRRMAIGTWAVNVVLLGGYTFGCHAFRHLVGGRKDSLAKLEAALAAYRCVSALNRKHMVFAWLSLFSVGFSDLYVRLCSMGVWTDWRLI